MLKALAANIEAWLTESRTRILTAMQTPVSVATKTGRNDLVTNVDADNQAFLVGKIRTAYPQAKIEAEEGTAAKVTDLDGLVFFVDPIDGTMNFVKQRANFAVMIGVYQDGAPLYGAIMDVMRNELVTGGPSLPPALNGQPVSLPLDRLLKDGLLGASGPMTIHNYLNLGDIALASSGARISGSAGMEFKAITLGQLVGYVSYLQPWDIAAGMAIGAGFGLQCSRPDGQPVDLLQAGVVVAAMPQAHAEILHRMQAK
ncbi:inositol monophosphatase family protein [Lacticaseibacillus camelliae]|uniref:Fructose-1 6-bisphosphatase n=1 Tax=Lacticaseibacillus camelliae DSM 22697 = JCM 13995 TaxID=1423730 RepID=A0A0R2FAY3_9LACO|nr:inositol monophosphatase family protein [Lacticaseibacillus camelliae]KRN25536.1 fructose-1 6-bisphosphatase [Lacticaseibacillus camelliae DSM 22697 = JCM 13995]